MPRYTEIDSLIEDLRYDIELDARTLDGLDLVDVKERERVQLDKVIKQNVIDILEHTPTADVVEKELYDRLLKNSIIISEALNKYQTADVVKVVRCKDCKHRGGTFHTDRRKKEGGYWIYWCELDTGDPFELGRCAEDDNWFCKDGDRREDDD